MKIYRGLAEARGNIAASAVTIGTLDGVHLGHQALAALTIEKARAIPGPALAITWDRHPSETLRPEHAPLLLSSLERKLELLEETGLDGTLVLPFDDELSGWSPQRFVTSVVVEGVRARSVVVGSDWRFGQRAAGDVPLLTELGREQGFEAEGVKLLEIAGGPVSSSRVRQAVANGDVVLARTLLGRAFDVDGTVIRGDARGKSLGVPTANLPLGPRMAYPLRGVYAGRARAGGGWYAAAINVGVNPTFGGDPRTSAPRIEAYLLEFEGDLYGQVLRVEFWRRLRDESKFDSAEALVEQIELDVQATRSVVTV
ncbi:MAG: riboflavin kinase / adenylyltransferase [Actinomycetota bacterium]|jgi:riboflavin kinase/FMN adenylyltransferase|nr:riboflavin kinase / adenylyltransferase [Actinomycetota bacterium]